MRHILPLIVILVFAVSPVSAQNAKLFTGNTFNFSAVLPLQISASDGQRPDMMSAFVYVTSVDTMIVGDSATFNKLDTGYRENSTSTSLSISQQNGVDTKSLAIVLDTNHHRCDLTYSDVNGVVSQFGSWLDFEFSLLGVPYTTTNGAITISPLTADSLRAHLVGSYSKRVYGGLTDHSERSAPFVLTPGTLTLTLQAGPSSSVASRPSRSTFSASLSSEGTMLLLNFASPAASRDIQINAENGAAVRSFTVPSGAAFYHYGLCGLACGIYFVRSESSVVRILIP